MSPAVVPHLCKVYSIVRKIYRRSPTDDLNDLWSIFTNVTLQAAVHLGRDYMENLRFTKNQLLKFGETVLPSDSKVDRGRKKSTYVFADSVLCLGSMRDQPVEACNNRIKWYLENRYLKDLNRIDGEPMEFEWTIWLGFTTLGILEEIQKFMTELQCEPEQFKDRIFFMSMFNDNVW